MIQLRGRVGRHANTGIHCQNWKDDQDVVIGLLNGIPAADGGAWHSLNGRVVAGIASEPLYRAILVFEKKHFRHQSGFVDPNGKMFPLMLKLGTRSYLPPAPPPPPPPKGLWDITTESVKRGLHQGLDRDSSLSHDDLVEIIRGVLSDSTITADETTDLSNILTYSKSMSPRSKKMLTMFINELKRTTDGKGPYSLATAGQQVAADKVCDFLKRSTRKSFTRLDRDEVGVGLLMRIANPGILYQGQAGICGPAAMLFSIAKDRPERYAKFATDLYELGEARIEDLHIEPGSDLRDYLPPAKAQIPQVDWMTMASLRDSTNWFLDYADFKDSGGTTHNEIEKWFEKAGYSDVRNEKNLFLSQDADNADEASRLFSKGYAVCLHINSKMLYADTQTESSHRSNHVVVLQSPINRTGGKVTLKIFTWGSGDFQIPSVLRRDGTTTQPVDLSLGDFLENYYGYVAGKP